MDNKLHLPKGIMLTDDGRIIYNWQRFTWSVALWLIIDLQIIGFTSLGIKKDIELGNTDYSGAPLFMLIACMSPVLVSSYFILGRFLNRTEFWVDGGELFIQHKPLPWFGNRAISLSDIEEFVIEETHVGRGHRIIKDTLVRRGTTTYHLMIHVRGKTRSELFPMFSRIFVDLTNDSRSEVVLALQQELMTLIRNRKY